MVDKDVLDALLTKAQIMAETKDQAHSGQLDIDFSRSDSSVSSKMLKSISALNEYKVWKDGKEINWEREGGREREGERERFYSKNITVKNTIKLARRVSFTLWLILFVKCLALRSFILKNMI